MALTTSGSLCKNNTQMRASTQSALWAAAESLQHPNALSNIKHRDSEWVQSLLKTTCLTCEVMTSTKSNNSERRLDLKLYPLSEHFAQYSLGMRSSWGFSDLIRYSLFSCLNVSPTPVGREDGRWRRGETNLRESHTRRNKIDLKLVRLLRIQTHATVESAPLFK